MAILWREQLKKITTPHQRHLLVKTREWLYGPFARATARWRVLPDFIIIGAPRSGTTHLFNTLRHHPQIKTSRVKEVKYFHDDTKYRQVLRKYRSYFPLGILAGRNRVVGEASPNYFGDERCAERIKKVLPEVKLIVMLRNPTERYLSGYFHKKQKGIQTTPDGTTVDDLLSDIPTLKQTAVEQAYIKKLSAYDEFYRRGRLLVIRSEDYFNNPQSVIRDVCAYLNIKQSLKLPYLKSKNSSRRYAFVSNSVRQQLDAVFEPYNQQLYKYLSRDMHW